MSSENAIIYDWLTFTSKIHDLDSMLEFLGFDDSISWQSLKGQNGYRDRLYYDGVSIHYNGSDDMGVCVSMSGKGCRTFETFGSGDYDYIFSEIIDNFSDDPVCNTFKRFAGSFFVTPILYLLLYSFLIK